MRLTHSLLASSALLAATIGAPAQAQTVIEELVVTAQKKEEALQDVPIAVSAFDQGALERSKIDGGSNLVLAVPNVNFSKGNFAGGYNFQIRGIGSKLVAGSGDAGTGIHLNNAPLITNNLFETEFYDMERVEVLRGPQGTLYGRNATGGVVNLITAKPTDQFEAHARAEYGNYEAIKLRGMVNIPLGDIFAFRAAGTYLKRDGYGTNVTTGNDADDRDMWGTRATLSFQPVETFRAWLLWDHFKEKDKRSRVGKQVCVKDPGPPNIGGVAYSPVAPVANLQRGFFTQGCLNTSIYAPGALGTTNSQSTLGGLFGALAGFQTGDAFAGKMQDPNIRNIESVFDPLYFTKTDIYEFNVEWDLSEELRLSWLSAYTYYDFASRADYFRYVPSVPFNTTPNPVNVFAGVPGFATAIYPLLFPNGVIRDPQNGNFNSFATSDLSTSNTEQWSHELRLQSNFDGPLNFNVGGIITRFQGTGDYFVFFNTGVGFYQVGNFFATGNPNCLGPAPCVSIDPNKDPDRSGHAYYDAYGPYDLTSYAVFGELYWQLADNFKITIGGRYTVDKKEVENHAVTLGVPGVGIGEPLPGTPPILKVKFKEPTGRVGFDWKPDLGFTDETLVYAFYARGYKAGGLNSPCSAGPGVICGPPTFEPEFINSFEIGTKNTLLNGTMTANLGAFHYDYKGYQVSKIVNRASTNENIDARVMGAEFESIWQPVEGLRFNVAVGYLDTKIKNSLSIDTLNRTQDNPNLIVVKSEAASNCVVTLSAAQRALTIANTVSPFALLSVCTTLPDAQGRQVGAGQLLPGSNAPAAGTNAFGDLVSDGVPVDLDGNELPNAPHWTFSFGAQYTWEFGDWAATLRGDYYRQTKTFARIWNSDADRIRGWDNLNFTLTIENSDLGVEVGAFLKNATDEKAVTDFYLTDDTSGLFRNTFYTEPRTYGVWVAKRF